MERVKVKAFFGPPYFRERDFLSLCFLLSFTYFSSQRISLLLFEGISSLAQMSFLGFFGSAKKENTPQSAQSVTKGSTDTIKTMRDQLDVLDKK